MADLARYVFGIHTNVGTDYGTAYPIRSVSDGRWKLIHNFNYQYEYHDWYISTVAWMNDWVYSKDPGQPKPYWCVQFDNSALH